MSGYRDVVTLQLDIWGGGYDLDQTSPVVAY